MGEGDGLEGSGQSVRSGLVEQLDGGLLGQRSMINGYGRVVEVYKLQ